MNKEILVDGIRQIIKNIGIENMTDGKRVIALFADLVPNGKTERNALKHTYDSGAMRIIVSLDGNSKNYEHIVLKAVEVLHDHAFMDKQVAKQIVESIMTAIYPGYMHVDNEETKLETKKHILASSQKEEMYDVFICCKETDANGQRTPDSVIANDIYCQLTSEGLKVFYAAITLDGKLGSAYEPIILAAINTAKVMLVIGTKPEHFKAPLVKNEWSKYLEIVKKNRSKFLIPCYRDMDAYDLPMEFAYLQARNMDMIGFISDLIRSVKKILNKNEPAPTVVKETTTNANTTNLAFDQIKPKNKPQDSSATAEKKPSFVVVDNVTGQPIDMSQYVIPISDSTIQNLQRIKNDVADSVKNDIEKALEFIIQEDGTYGVKAKVRKRDFDVVYEGPPNIIIPETYRGKPVTTLEKNAFEGCQGVKSIVIPSSIHTVKVLAFDNLKMSLLRLETHNRHFRIEGNCFIENESERLIHGDETSHIPHGIKIIGEWAFAQCYDLKNIQLPNSIVSIENNAFYSCTRLNNLVIPDGVKRIGRSAFYGCHRLVDITLPDSIVEIGTMAFDNLHQLNVRSLPRKLEYLGSFVFSYYSWKAINIPDTLKKFDEPGFHGEDFLKLRISNTNPYYEIKNLCLLEKQTGRLIGNGNNQSIDIPDGVTVIGNSAFTYQTDLQSVYIPQSVKKIEDGAFKNSIVSTIIYGGSLEEWVKISANIPELSNVPVDCMLKEDRRNEKLFDFEKHEGKEYSEDFLSYRVFEYYAISLKQGIDCPSKITIPLRFKGLKVAKIKYAAFKNCTALESVEIPEGIDTIESYAFYGCINLSSISIAPSVRSIGSLAFSKCEKLVQVVLPSNLTKVDVGLFGDCVNLYSVTIPRSVTSIESCALWGCKRIKKIIYYGTKNDWKRIQRAKSKIVKLNRLCLLHSWKAHSGKFIVSCTDKKVSKSRA